MLMKKGNFMILISGLIAFLSAGNTVFLWNAVNSPLQNVLFSVCLIVVFAVSVAIFGIGIIEKVWKKTKMDG